MPSAQVMVLESQDRVLHQAPCSAGNLLLPPPSPLLMLSLTLSLSNKILKKKVDPEDMTELLRSHDHALTDDFWGWSETGEKD